ncbi:zinc finger MYM-type protein 5 isoform X3 [Zalophus californianus]|uniref:Zinc finger MYM-type protein 5 isoform X3 n=1 Tax=Zalophus californianus TaxID=9704 RepID=A0A6P9FKC1_ZALCA|nr:zinc finger MYM-type protein 5 isoform X3 [Zalophus californianus]
MNKREAPSSMWLPRARPPRGAPQHSTPSLRSPQPGRPWLGEAIELTVEWSLHQPLRTRRCPGPPIVGVAGSSAASGGGGGGGGDWGGGDGIRNHLQTSLVKRCQKLRKHTSSGADQRNFIFASSRNERLQGNYSIILPSSRDLASEKGNVSETIVIDDEEDIETNGGEKKNSSNFIEWGLPGTKNRTKDLDFSTSSLSRSKTKTAVGPFNPGRMNVAGVEFQNGGYATHHSPDSWISQSASFPRNQKQPGVDSLSPVASLPKQIFQSSVQQQLTKPAKITCAHCKKPLQKGQTAYQRKGSAHLFCSTTCLSSFSHKRTPKKRNVIKKDVPTKRATNVPQVESRESSQEFCSTSLPPYEDNQNLRKRINKSRCIICSKLTEIRHEVSVNNVIHKLCSNQCFNKYRLANGLIMNCCEQCGEYLPNKSAGNNVLIIEGQQTRFCCQGCVNEYKQMLETKSKNLSASENRKRNAVREEENERKAYGPLNTLLEKKEGIPEKKEKTSELQVLAEYSTDTSLIKQDVNLPSSMLTIADKFQEPLEEKKSEDCIISVVLSTDPGTWPRILNTKQRDILVENDPPQVRNFNFPKDNTGRKFSETYYTRILPNGDKTTRSWLLYSTAKDSVFCLYCKLFGEGKNQLKNENGCKDWQHLSHILSKHEESEMHINNSVKYSKLKSDLKKNKTVESAEHGLHENEKNDGVLLLYT